MSDIDVPQRNRNRKVHAPREKEMMIGLGWGGGRIQQERGKSHKEGVVGDPSSLRGVVMMWNGDGAITDRIELLLRKREPVPFTRLVVLHTQILVARPLRDPPHPAIPLPSRAMCRCCMVGVKPPVGCSSFTRVLLPDDLWVVRDASAASSLTGVPPAGPKKTGIPLCW